MKFIKLLKIFYPSKIKKVVNRLYSIAESENGRTIELSDLIKSNQVQSFVEVGVYDGDNLLRLAKRFPTVSFIGVDPYYDGEYNDRYELKNKDYWDHKYDSIMKKVEKLDNLRIIRKSSLEAVVDFKFDSVDLVFIDAIHTYKDCKDDINHWLEIVKLGGVLSGHDYSLTYFGVIMAVNEILGIDNIKIGQDSTWFYTK
jgi:predicted O-methyltransferase YrrM